MFSKNYVDQPQERRQKVFSESISKLIKAYMHMPGLANNAMKQDDHIVGYSTELLSLGLLYMEFVDAIQEGDGERILRCWRYMFLVFKVTDKRKYAIQAFNMLAQYHFLFTERMRHQLLSNRTVNVHGRHWKNIPMDLHMEQLNRELKCAIGNSGSNVTDKTIERIAYCLRRLVDIKMKYDSYSAISTESGHHSLRFAKNDLMLVIQCLNDAQVFLTKKGRYHSQFPNLKSNVAQNLKKKELKLWMTNLLTYM